MTLPKFIPRHQILSHRNFLIRGRAVGRNGEWWDGTISLRLAKIGLKLNGREGVVG